MVKPALIAVSAALCLYGADNASSSKTNAGAAYAGSRVCAGCHARIYRNYLGMAMGRSMVAASSPGQLAAVPGTASIFNEKLNRHFEVSRQGPDTFQTESELDGNGHEVFRTTHQLAYVIGSGVNGFTYLLLRGDYLFQAPLSFYSRKQSWDLSPGYEFADYGFNRPAAEACIACHSGQPQPVPGREGLYGNPPFRELAIGCENCHGPGALHASAMAKANGNAAGTIVNPAKLPPRLAEDICMNCHQGGDTRVLLPGKDYLDFRPGTPLRETLAIFRIPLKRETAGDSDLLEHHLSMQLSRCYRASNGRLSCLTCHQIHSMPRPTESAAYYRSRCLTCHAEASCQAPKARRLALSDDCIACHMPKRAVQEIAHSELTNHRIIARAGEPLPDVAFTLTTEDLSDLIYLNRAPDARRSSVPKIVLLQAYGELLEKDPSYEARYLNVLDDLSRSAPDQPLVQAALGRRALRGGPASNSEAIDHLTRAIRLGFTAPAVYGDLAEALGRAGRDAEAVTALDRGIELSPYTPVLYKSLALRYIHLKQYADAQKTLERYVDLFPEDDFVRGLLLKVRSTSTLTGR